MNKGIDLIIPWVDGSDLNWLNEKSRFSEQKVDVSNSTIRYRDWDNLQYIFRGIEKNMPWVRKVHLITCGHLPKWLNLKQPKLNIIKHEDYIPAEYLPTFSSHVIELNLHRIADLSEKFIYFNDDLFILDSLKESDFFTNELPNDFLIESPIINNNPSEIFPHVLLNNNAIINKNFSKRKQIKINFNKYFSFKYGKHLVKNINLFPFNCYVGFQNIHICQSFLKSTYIEVWSKEEEYLYNVCKNKFRGNKDVNQYLFRDWQLVSGKFYPSNQLKIGKYIVLEDDTKEVVDIIKSKKFKIICLNDTKEDIEFIKVKNVINSALEYLYKEKSSFELN